MILLAAVAGLEYGWGARTVVLEPYYAAAVRSMAHSWHDFVYGAFDPAGTVTVDKLPGALWLQALSVRAFGLHVWAIVLPQIAEGVLTVLVLYRAVARLGGPIAGVTAAAVLVAMPANVALDRGNISDSLLVLLAVLAADAAGRALTRGGWWALVETGIWVGLAFQAKMAQAWLVLIPIGVTYLWLGPGRVVLRGLQLGATGLVTGVISLSWMAWVSLQPAAGRPFVDGSTDNSVWAQVFQYNGLGRFNGGGLLGNAGTPTAAAARLLGPGLLDFTVRAPAGWHRLLSGAEGRDIGWLIPVAALAGIAVMVGERRRNPLAAAGALLWLVWMAVHLVAFSWATSINPYYPAVITPAVAGLCGLGLARAWARRDALVTQGLLAVAILISAAYALWLADTSRAASWTAVVIVATAAAALVAVAISRFFGGKVPEPDPDATADLGVPVTARRPVLAGALVLTVVAGVAAPVAAGWWLIQRNLGPFDTPYEPLAVQYATQSASLQNSPILNFTVNSLSRFDQGTTYVFATHSALIASPFIFGTGKEILPIGGFTGLAPEPTVAQLSQDVASGQLRFVLANPSSDPRIQWVEAHCKALNPQVPGQHSALLGLYLCSA